MKADIFKTTIEENHQRWIDFVNGSANLDEIIQYKNFTDHTFNNTISEIITHVINHGTHHRAQIGQHLKLAGIEKLLTTDHILFAMQ